MLNIAICDDSQDDRLKIEKLIKEYCCVENCDINIHNYENGEPLIDYYATTNTAYDIIFLDIYMNGTNGITTAKQIRKFDSKCKIIFTTSSSEHALESFEVFPYNYMVKPVKKDMFEHVFRKAVNEIDQEKQKSLTIKIGSGIQTIFYKDIFFVESYAKTLNIHVLQGKTFSFYARLDEIEKQIADKRFLRCHKSFLINMDHVLSAEDYHFNLDSGKQIPITQRYFADIKKVFYNYVLDKANLNKNR